MNISNDIKHVADKMQNAVTVFKNHLATVRAGRPSPDLLNNLKINVYGQAMPLNQLASVTVSDNSLMLVQVWDKSNLEVIDITIRTSDLGLNPVSDGAILKIALPKLSEERRHELVKLCSNYTEQAKIAIRNIRRDEIDKIRKSEKNSEISEDDMHRLSDLIQKETDSVITMIEQLFNDKKADIIKV